MACGERVRNLCGETRHLMGRIGVQVPPSRSVSTAISRALRCRVPLKTACSIKWQIPFSSAIRGEIPGGPRFRRHGPETRHVFCQDSDPVRESGSLNVVYHSFRDPKLAKFTNRGC
jgi:hypothetical protein